MKLTIKTLKQVSYPLEIHQEATVGQLKLEIETKHNFDSKSMKLLYNGVVLVDEKLLSEIGIKEGQIIMMMNSKAKPQNISKEEKKQEESLLNEIGNLTYENQSFVFLASFSFAMLFEVLAYPVLIRLACCIFPSQV